MSKGTRSAVAKRDEEEMVSNPDSATAVVVIEKTGDLFTAPANSILVHSCNAEGVWGAGIARRFKEEYWKAHEEYQQYCSTNGQLGTVVFTKSSTGSGQREHSVGSLIVKAKRGKPSKAEKETVLQNTRSAVEQLVRLVRDDGEKDIELHMPKINGGIFSIPWERTREVLESLDPQDLGVLSLTIFVYSRDS